MSERLLIEGGNSLSGEVRPSGFKHACVMFCAAALVERARVKLLNVPNVEETQILSTLLNSIGGNVSQLGNILFINLDDVTPGLLNSKLTRRIHGAIYLLPGLLSRFGKATLPITGGCQIGGLNLKKSRPIDHYVDVLRRFGVNTYINDTAGIEAAAKKLQGCRLDLRDFSSSSSLWGLILLNCEYYSIL